MKRELKYILFLITGLSLAGCTDTIVDDGGGVDVPEAEKKAMVLMSVGNEKPESTRAGNITYMPNHVRFTAMMLTKATAQEDYTYGKPFYANMLVDNFGAGNSLYYQSTYKVPSDEKKDNYNNDDDASIFYWQNRLSHGFIGYIDDFNKALPWAKHQAGDSEYSASTEYFPKTLSGWNTSAPAAADGKEDKSVQNFLYTMKKDGTLLSWQQYEKFDLRNNSTITSMSMQKDPLIAYEEKVPESSSPEKNRVYLTFRHQLAQVQVNLKGSAESADIVASQIDGVALLGVSLEAYVFPYPQYGFKEIATTTPVLDADGNPAVDGDGNPIYEAIKSWGIMRQGNGNTKTELLRSAYAVPLTLEQQNANPPAGSQFDMFQMADGKQATGYLKGFEAIAFGNLKYLRIQWHENDENGNPDIQHIVQFPITDDRFKKLESGKRYIINLELRLGTVAAVSTEIVDWIPYTTVYESDGKVVKGGS